MKRLAVGVGLVSGACSESSAPSVPDATVDATATPDAPPEPCWPADVGQLTPRGTVTVGAGTIENELPSGPFIPLGDELPLHYMLTDGFALTLNARMTGLVPGNPLTTLASENPWTRFSVTFVDRDAPLTEHVTCGVTYGYKPSPLGGYELPVGVWSFPRLCWRASDLVGQRVRVQAEIVDADGGYASDAKVVTLTAAPGSPNDEGAPGCEAP